MSAVLADAGFAIGFARREGFASFTTFDTAGAMRGTVTRGGAAGRGNGRGEGRAGMY